MAATVGKEAEALGHLISSKIYEKKWPQIERVVGELKEFCKLDVRVRLVGQELKHRTGGGGRENRAPSPQHTTRALALCGKDGEGEGAGAGGGGGGRERNQALPRVELACVSTSTGDEFPLCTNSEGVAEISLYPGRFRFYFPEDSGYDAVNPDVVEMIMWDRFDRGYTVLGSRVDTSCQKCSSPSPPPGTDLPKPRLAQSWESLTIGVTRFCIFVQSMWPGVRFGQMIQSGNVQKHSTHKTRSAMVGHLS